jgi:threonine/homoserine efflux transporter RhtA
MNGESVSFFLRLALGMVFAAALAAQLWPTRGPVIGVIAVVFYGALFAIALSKPKRLKAWSRRHPALDAAILAPVTFLALCLFDIPLVLCAVIGATAGAVLVAFVLWRRRRERPDADDSVTPLMG